MSRIFLFGLLLGVLTISIEKTYASLPVEEGEKVVCQNPQLDTPKRGRRGLSVELKKIKNEISATLKKVRYSLMKKQKKSFVIATLPCTEVKSGAQTPDLPQAVLECESTQSRDNGFHIALTSADFTGKFTAKVSKLSVAGKVEKSEEPCKLYKQDE